MSVVGFDTSNYTTSIAFFDGNNGLNCSRLLPVKEGELGLRQSDAVFHHTKSLPELSGRLFSNVPVDEIAAVKTNMQDRPLRDQKIVSITVETFGEEYPEPDKLKDPYGRF